MNNITFTIVTVCYNEIKTIKTTLESVLNQTYDNFEYIVIDGASTDGSFDLVRSYEKAFTDRGIHCIFLSEKDSGIYNAMNKAIRLANGEWINFMNAGDCFISPDVLTNIGGQIEDTDDIVYGGTVITDGMHYRMRDTLEPCELMKRMCFCHQSSFSRTIWMKECLFDENYRISADYKFFLNSYLQKKHFRCLNSIVALFCNNGISSTNEDFEQKEKFAVQLELGIITEPEYHQRLIDIENYKIAEQKYMQSRKHKIRHTIKTLLPGFILKILDERDYKKKGWTRDLNQLLNESNNSI